MRSSPRFNALTIFTTRMFALASILLLSVVAVMAQATTGTLRGTVTDTNGGVVSGATVTVKSASTGSVNTTTTNTEGTFDASFLQPGAYTVTVEAPNFKRSVSNGVMVKIGIVNPVSVVLEAGNVAETVTVTANTEEIVRDQSQVSTTIEARRIQELPSNGAGNGIDTLALLAPGVIANRAGGTNTNGTGLSVNGNRGRSNNFQIDGTDNNDLSVAGPALFVDFQDSVQEFQVITNSFSAQYGRNQGAIINIVTPHGTNSYHGTGFWFHRDNRNLNSLNNQENASGQLKPNRDLYNVAGATFGGPVPLPHFGEGGKMIKSGKDKLFFWYGYQGIREPATTTNNTTSLAVIGSELPRLATTFPGNAVINTIVTYSPFAIPGASPNTFVAGTGVQALINTNAPNLVAGCPRAIAQGAAQPKGSDGVTVCPAYANLGPFLIGGPYDVLNFGTATAPLLFQGAQYQRSQPTAYTENYNSLRFDWKASSKDDVTVRYLNQTSASQNALQTTTSGFNGDIPAGSKNQGVSWIRQINNSVVNDARVSYNKIRVEFGGGCITGTPGCIPGPAEIGVALANITFPALGLTKANALATIGPATNLPQGRIGKVYQYADNLSWTKGRHSFLFGAEYKHLTELSPFLPNYNGAYGFNSQARLVNNAPSSVAITGGDPLLLFPENDQYYFIQDDFKFRSNLTLNLGLRYEYTGQPLNTLHDQTVARENGPNGFYAKTLPLATRTVPLTPADKNNWAPRVGFAWSPKIWKSLLGEDATVIRGGFSIAYDAAYYNILLNVQNAAPFSAALNLSAASLASTTTSPSPLPNNPTGDVVRAAANASGVLPLGQLDPTFLSQTKVANDFRAPYSEQFSLGIQHQFGRKHVAEIRYVGTHGVALFQNINSNFFIGPIINGIAITRNAGGSVVPCASSPATPCLNGRSFANLVPPGTVSQVCPDIPGTLFINESACDQRQFRTAGVTTRANTSQSIYHSLQARYNGRWLNDSLNIGAAYTFSKTIDDASEIFAFTGGDILSASAQNPFCVNRCERGRSGLDRPHAFSANFIYDTPWMREQRGVLGHLVGGWQLNGTYILTSGGVWTPGQGGNGTIGLGNAYLTAGDRPFLTNPNADRRLVGITRIDAFLLGRIAASSVTPATQGSLISLTALQANGSIVAVTPNDVKYVFNGPGAAQVFGTPFGSVGRGIERGPIFNQLNMGLFKNLKVWEHLSLQLRGEAFNVLNHPQPGIGSAVTGGTNHLPNINVNNAGISGAAFGETLNQTYARRVVQVGLRVIF
jgi:outer membrane receptor protein involved in Fe transport